MKSEKKEDDFFHVRFCWNCCSPMYFEHFLAWNPQERQSVLTKLWNNPMVQILCCSCIEKGLSEFTSTQIEVKCFIMGKIGNYKYSRYFGRLNPQHRKVEYQETIPGKNLYIIIAKEGSKMEQLFRSKFNYSTLKPEHFHTFIDKFYHERPFSIISEIIGEEGGLTIEIPTKLAPAIFSNPNHEFIALLAPIKVGSSKKMEFKELRASFL